MSKPQPVVNEISEPFWTGLNEQRICVQQCQEDACQHVFLYPRVCCPYCRSDRLGWINASGQGRVISHTTIYRAHHPGFESEVPYVFGAIELAEGALVYGQIPGAPTSGVSLVGRSVNALFRNHSRTQVLLAFRLDN